MIAFENILLKLLCILCIVTLILENIPAHHCLLFSQIELQN
jgi:hypothetical protein